MWPPPPMLRFAGSVGCTAVEFPFTDCLLTLRPWEATRKTPNLSCDYRALLGLAGIVQRPPWSIAASIASGNGGVLSADPVKAPDENRLSFFCDSGSTRWRYLAGQYETFGDRAESSSSVTVKNGNAERYLRVCQSEMNGHPLSFALVARLVRTALEQRALGVRWAVYGTTVTAKGLASRLRRFGFLCVRRTRKLMIYANWPELESSANWDLHDSIFSFDP